MSFKYKELRAHFEQLLAALESIFSVHLATQRKVLKGKKKKRLFQLPSLSLTTWHHYGYRIFVRNWLKLWTLFLCDPTHRVQRDSFLRLVLGLGEEGGVPHSAQFLCYILNSQGSPLLWFQRLDMNQNWVAHLLFYIYILLWCIHIAVAKVLAKSTHSKFKARDELDSKMDTPTQHPQPSWTT